MSPRLGTNLPPAPESARAARRFVSEVLAVWGCDDHAEIAVLLTSEVVSNAVRHAATELALSVDLDEDVLRIAVRDRSERLPELQDPGSEALGGRGLVLVERLARRWGAQGESDGKVVWFELGPEQDDSQRRQ